MINKNTYEIINVNDISLKYHPIMRKVIKKEIESIQKDITHYKNIITEYQRKGLL